jgi:hypothetical protein
VVVAGVVGGCAQPVSGTAVAGSPPSQAADPTAPKLATARNLDGVDPCAMLADADVQPYGKLSDQPKPSDDQIPESCAYKVDDGSGQLLTLVTARYKPYAEVRAKQTRGHEVLVSGNSAWVYCNLESGTQTCTASVAVSATRTALVALGQRGLAEAKAQSMVQALAKAVLSKLPPAR